MSSQPHRDTVLSLGARIQEPFIRSRVAQSGFSAKGRSVRTSRRFGRAGFVACALVLGSDALRANDALDFWRQEYTRQHGSAEPSWSQPPTRFIVRPRRAPEPDRDRAYAGSIGERYYCVRTCDGFYFPLAARGSASKAEMCRALCPAAPTEVYRLGGGADSIENAVSERGKSYQSLPNALAYRKSLKPGCACRGAGATAMAVPITQDPTLARGDIVVTQKGVHVFAGGKFPHRDDDFVHYRSYRGLSREISAMLSLIDRPFRAAELKQTLDLRREPAATGRQTSVRVTGGDAL
jgi:hypothetical protein